VYEGSIKNIQLEVGGNLTSAPAWLTQTAGTVTMMAGIAYSGASSVQPIIDNGGGGYTLSQLEQAQFITPTQRAQLEGGLKAMGVPQEQINVMNVTQVQGAYTSAGNQLTGVATTLNGTSAQLGDKEVQTEQTGTGFTPILGLNFSPNEDWNIGIKYENKTYMTLTNNTEVDDLGLFPDGVPVNSDVPAILGIGVGYKGLDWLEVQLSYTEFFNKRVGWGANVRDMSSWEDVDPTKIRQRMAGNGYEAGLGLQFNLSENFAVSAGGLYGDMNVEENYQSDFSYSNPSFTLGGGIMWKITDKLTLDAGVSNTFYQDQTVNFADPLVPSYNDVYGKTALSLAAGITYSIF
jgi:long-subunit fatty acid transport protein